MRFLKKVSLFGIFRHLLLAMTVQPFEPGRVIGLTVLP